MSTVQKNTARSWSQKLSQQFVALGCRKGDMMQATADSSKMEK